MEADIGLFGLNSTEEERLLILLDVPRVDVQLLVVISRWREFGSIGRHKFSKLCEDGVKVWHLGVLQSWRGALVNCAA